MGGLSSIIVDEEDLKNRTNQQINAIINFNNEHILMGYNVTQSNIAEEEQYISCMTPTGLINGQDKSRCYVNSQFQVHFFNISNRKLVVNIDCDKII